MTSAVAVVPPSCGSSSGSSSPISFSSSSFFAPDSPSDVTAVALFTSTLVRQEALGCCIDERGTGAAALRRNLRHVLFDYAATAADALLTALPSTLPEGYCASSVSSLMLSTAGPTSSPRTRLQRSLPKCCAAASACCRPTTSRGTECPSADTHTSTHGCCVYFDEEAVLVFLRRSRTRRILDLQCWLHVTASWVMQAGPGSLGLSG